MTTANDVPRAPATATADGAPPNGSATLRDRVRSLRLAERGGGGGGASFPARVLPWGLCLILAGVAAAFGYYAYAVAPNRAASAAQVDDQAKAAKDESPSAASAALASSGEVALEAKGYIIPVHQIQVSPKVSGMLIDVNKDLIEGALFHKDDELATIETKNYDLQLAHARAAHVAARYDKGMRQANLDQKRLAYAHDSRAGTGISQDVLDKDRTDVANAEQDLAKAEANEDVADADEKLAQWNVDNCVIRAPVTGVILKKGAEKGNIVNPIAFNIASSLCDMADLSDLEVDLKVQERDIPKVKKGQACVAMPEAYQTDPDFLQIHPKGYTGKVSRLMPTADRGQGAIPVRVKLDIPKEEEGVYLKPDMGVIVEFLKGTSK